MNKDIKSIRQCMYCHNFCKSSCQPYLASKNQKIIQNQKNYLFYLCDAKRLKADPELGRAAYLCNDCRRCEAFCIYDNKSVLQNNRYSRSIIFKNGLAPEKIYEIEKNLINTGNIFGLKRKENKGDFNVSEKYEVMIYAGDYINYFKPEILENFIKILKKLNIGYVFCEDEISDGLLALDFGMEDLFKDLMKLNIKNIKKYNFDNLVVLDPHSYYCFIKEYEKFGCKLNFEVTYYIDFIENNISSIMVKKVEDKIKYFDPCILGRGMNIYETPRNILKNIFDKSDVDLNKNRKESYCCGGYISLFDSDLSNLISSNLMNEIKNFDSDTDVLITSCPLCSHNLENVKDNKKPKVYDISEYIAINMY